MSTDKQIIERDKRLLEILNSSSPKIVLLAGAGCGKTYTFKQLLKKFNTTPQNALAITFINTLVKDLAEDLSDIAEVKTFHSLAHKILRGCVTEELTKGFEVFEGNDEIIKEDYRIISDTEPPDFANLFRTLSTSEELTFYFNRCKYYDSVGHDDVVYRVIKKRKEGVIPPVTYAVIVVDEFQDFNSLEVEFIEKVLEAKTKLLIAGDDDQAIYAFRSASPSHIRLRAKDSEYKLFSLPFCSRCTNVVVEATNRIISTAITQRKLLGRIHKEFECLIDVKSEDNKKFPKIVHANCTVHTPRAPYVSKYIASVIKQIDKLELKEAAEGNYPPVLVIGKLHYIKSVAQDLKNMGYEVDLKLREDSVIKNLVYSLALLKRDPDSNLGWRIILNNLKPSNLEEIILSTTSGKNLTDLVTEKFKEKVLKIIDLVGLIGAKEVIREADKLLLTKFFGISYEEICDLYSSDKKDPSKSGKEKSLKVKLTTHFGAKGLSGGRVFIVDFNDQSFPKISTSPTDTEICQLIIDVTRTRKECHLVSNKRFGRNYPIRPSIFIDWIGEDLIKSVRVDKEFFKSH